jgi:hypothetical protein
MEFVRDDCMSISLLSGKCVGVDCMAISALLLPPYSNTHAGWNHQCVVLIPLVFQQ